MSAWQNTLNERLNEKWQPVRVWFSRLNPREQTLVLWGGIGTAALIFVFGGVLPLYAATGKAAQRVEQKQDDLSWMHGVAAELRAAGPATNSAQPGGSLIVIVDRSAHQSGLGSAITGSQPSGNGGLRVRVEGAAFDTLVGWLALLEQQHGIGVETASVDRTAKPGRVNASLVLRQGSAGGK